MKKISFFGHRCLWGVDIRERIEKTIMANLDKETQFLIGTHGEFDRLALSICKGLRKIYPEIKITVVFTNLSFLKRNKNSICGFYDDFQTMVYEIEEEHYKNKIIVSNRKMIDESDLIICYVNMKEQKSGAKMAVRYASRKGKMVINLFDELSVEKRR